MVLGASWGIWEQKLIPRCRNCKDLRKVVKDCLDLLGHAVNFQEMLGAARNCLVPGTRFHFKSSCVVCFPLNFLAPTEVNMKFEPFVFDCPPFIAVSCKMPSTYKKPIWKVIMQCGTNTRNIVKGEYLHFSMMDDQDPDSDP